MSTEEISVPRFLSIFKRFSTADKIRIADQIDRETLEARWKALDEDLPDVVVSDEEIMAEVRAERHARKKDR